ncbi:hypothetical protein JOB18_040534 [Solea senegalensis]|uniref:Uncharacterized protein n=1 Tax=Solea senegalensis TaxID=28829 RepID=A0AAV6S6E4_SOLSE|nr:radial spoke head protein 3 homolog [Solea senegalensis]KAG7512811.1 hypothetical protein JOB18_040534 [Solea senegalensis]
MAFNSPHKRLPSRIYALSGYSISVENVFRSPPENAFPHDETITYDCCVVTANPSAEKRSPRREATALNHTSQKTAPKTAKAPPVSKDSGVQTDPNLGEMSVAKIVTGVESQTNTFQSTPTIFIPPKIGKDISIQIEQGELFDFDREVPPLVEIMVDKVIEQSVLEVKEEDELARLGAQQKAFQELRNSELAEVQRLKEQVRRHREERERRIIEQKEAQLKERETAEKIAARAYTKECLADLYPAVFTSFSSRGFFDDPVVRDIETHFLPWLMAEVCSNLEKKNSTRKVLDTIVHNLVQMRHNRYKEQSVCDM